MARLRYNGVATTLGAGLSAGVTTITLSAALTHSGGTNVPTVAAPDILPLSILNGDGVVEEIVYLTAYTAGATTGTITRAQEGTSDVTHANGAVVQHAPTVADANGLLAYKWHNPASATYTISTNTLTDLDATNAVITFVTPPSGRVLITMQALAQSGAGTLYWGLREAASQVGESVQVINGSSGPILARYVEFPVEGLTPGSVHTYKWAWRVSSGSASIYYGSTVGDGRTPLMMKVIALP